MPNGNRNEDGSTPTLKLAGSTLVFDRDSGMQVMWIDGVVVLPVGSEIELVEPNVNAVVVGVRLLAGFQPTPSWKGLPVKVCLDVRVPAEYWG